MSDYSKYVKEEWGDRLAGRTITRVRQMTDEEVAEFGWFPGGSDPAIIVFMDDDSFFIPAADPELNGPGYLLMGDKP